MNQWKNTKNVIASFKNIQEKHVHFHFQYQGFLLSTKEFLLKQYFFTENYMEVHNKIKLSAYIL